MLILLDDAASTRQVAPLIPGQGQSLLLVTSPRRLVGIHAGFPLILEPLSTADAIRVLSRIIGCGRVGNEPAAARSLVEACARLPLAIRIAGARLAARPEYPLEMFGARLRLEDYVLDEFAFGELDMRGRLDACYGARDPAVLPRPRQAQARRDHPRRIR
jgi:hypothetical protein